MAGNSQANAVRGSQPGIAPDSSQAAPDRSNSQLQTDTKLVVGMVLGSMFHDNGVQQIIQMVQQAGNDAPAAAAHAIYVGLAQARHALEQQGIPVDSKIWVMDGGVLNQLVIEIGKILASSLGPQFASKQFLAATAQAVLQIMQQQESGNQPQPDAAPAQAGGLAAPQGGM